MSHGPINILMTGGGAPGAPGILKCLQANPEFNVTVADANPNAIGRYLNADFEVIPLASEKNFIESILSLCRKKNIHVVLPLVTKELLPLALNKQKFEAANIKVLVSDAPSLEIAVNKSSLYEFLQWRSIDVPDFRIVATIEQFRQAVSELGYPEKKVCFKPSVSNGSRGFRIISDNIDEFHLLFNEKPNCTYINFEEAARILSSGTFPELLISEYLPGEEFSVDCLVDHGSTVVIIPRLRKKMVNGISVEGEFIPDKNIISYCELILKALQLHGNIGIQVKKSFSGKFLILEINPRVQGTIVAAFGAGVNLPVLALKQELKVPVKSEELQVKWGTKFSRFWEEVYY
jgi:carbamoyl-phosphate synthase large subunit